MRSQSQLEQFVQDKPLVAIGIVVIVLGLVGFLGTMVYRQLSPAPRTPEVAVVEFSDGQNTVTVERSGKVTIKTPFGTYTQHWDKEKIRRFFEQIDHLDFDLLSKFLGTDLAVQLTLSNGETKTIYLTESQEPIIQAIQQALNQTYTEQEKINGPLPTLDPITIVTPSPRPAPGSTATPRPSSGSGGGSSGSGGNNPWKQGSEVQDPQAFNCGTVQNQAGKRVVVSNTLCQQ